MLTLGQLLYDLNDSYTIFDVYEQTDDHIPQRTKILSDATQDEIIEFSKTRLLDEVILAYNDLVYRTSGCKIHIVLAKKEPNP